MICPPALRDHLLDRARERQVSFDDLYRLKLWRESAPEAPDGIAIKDSWKNDQGDYETRTVWHRVYAWRNLSRFAKTLKQGQVIGVDGTIREGT